MDVYGRKLFKAIVKKAHVDILTDAPILILAKTQHEADRVLRTQVGGWKRHEPYELNEEEFSVYHELDVKYKKILDRCGFLHCYRENGKHLVELY